MAESSSSSKERLSSARSIKSSDRGMEVLSPEGSTVYITQLKDGDSSRLHGNGKPITSNSSTTIIGVPRKSNTQDLVEFPLTDQSLGSPDSDNEEGPPPSPATILRDAGVDLDLSTLTCEPGQAAPLDLLSQFMSCVMRYEYEAAQVLCKKILEFEPTNEIALEFLPVISERLQLDADLSTESGSSSDSSSGSEINFVSSGDEDSESDQDDDIPSVQPNRHCACHHDNKQ